MDLNEEIKLELESSAEQPDSSDDQVKHDKTQVQDKKSKNEINVKDSLEDSNKKVWITCPYCKFKQVESEKCGKCGIVFKKMNDELDQNDKIDQLHHSFHEEKTSWVLKFFTVLVFLFIIISFAWSYYFFVYQKPWRKAEIESITVRPIDSENIEETNKLRLQSKKETIEALKRALNSPKKFKQQEYTKTQSSDFKLKNIPVPLLEHYQGKYVWVTCENGAVHQGTLYAVYSEQIILTKPNFNLTIPINRSMIDMVEYDYSENEHDENSIEAYKAYKRKTQESLQNIPISSLNSYIGKNIRIYLNSGQMHEGILSELTSQRVTIENIVYGQMITIVILKKNIDKILY